MGNLYFRALLYVVQIDGFYAPAISDFFTTTKIKRVNLQKVLRRKTSSMISITLSWKLFEQFFSFKNSKDLPE